MGLYIKGLNCFYGDRKILSNIEINGIEKGTFTVLLGPNGAGKSTLFKAISGLLACDTESMTLEQENLRSMPRDLRFKQVCYLPQTFNITANLTVFETILLARKNNAAWSVSEQDIERVSSLVHRLGLTSIAHTRIGQLSGGQQQLAAICQAMVRDAALFLLDEPTSALDINREMEVLRMLKNEAHENGTTMIVSLHDLTLAAKFADQLIVMKNGKVKAIGETEAVLQSGVIESTYNVEIELLRTRTGNLVVAAE